jgi:hypothetical protein
MIDVDAIEYSQVRLQARFGGRPSAAEWRRIETARELPTLFEFARSTAFRPLVAGLAPDQNVHKLEAGLRGHWRELALEVAGWLPGRWQGAAAWFAYAPDLPIVDYLLRGGAARSWMNGDQVFGALAAAEPAVRRHALREGPLAELERALGGKIAPETLAQAWIDVLRERLPENDEEAHLTTLGRILNEHRQAIIMAHPGEAMELRQSLTTRLEMLFRRAALTPAAGFCFLALAALDFLRLRGEIARRAALP